MQIKSLSWTLAVLLPVAAALAGCDGNAATAPGSSASAARPAYELVTQRRPLSPTAYFTTARAGYDACVGLAKSNNLPVKPFVRVPDNFIAQRTTFKSDGAAMYWKTQDYTIDVASIEPETGCKTKISEIVDVQRMGNGKIEQLGIDKDGQSENVSRAHDKPLKNGDGPDDLAMYSVARIEKGIALKCLAPDSPALKAGLVAEMCIVDAGAGLTLRSASGDPLVAFARETVNESMTGITLIEPVSLKLGKVDPTVFSGALK